MKNNRMFRIRNLPNLSNENFPFVESNFDAVTDYELLSKALKEVHEVNKKKIPTKVSELKNDLGFINKIKTINNQSLIGTGDIHIDGSSYDDTEIWEKINLIDEDLGTVQSDIQEIKNDIDNIEEKMPIVIDVGSYQYNYNGTVLPAISVDNLRLSYSNDIQAIPQILKWTLYGTTNNLKIVSSDLIAGEYSIDVLIHNKYHCEYKWTDSTTGNVNPNVATSDGNFLNLDLSNISEDGISYINGLISDYVDSLNATEVEY